MGVSLVLSHVIEQSAQTENIALFLLRLRCGYGGDGREGRMEWASESK